MITFKEFISESNNFVRPDPNEEHNEVYFQLNQLKNDDHNLPKWVKKHLTSLSDKTAFHNAVKNAKIKNILPHEYSKIHNTTGNMTEIEPEKRNRVAKLFSSKKPITSPIILYNKDTNEKYCLAGHTRLAHNSLIKKKPTPTLHLEYKPIKESKNFFKKFISESKIININHEFGYGKVKVIHDPTKKHVDNLLNAGHSIRGTHTEHGVFIWKAADAIHHHIRNDLNKKHGFDIPSTPNSQSNSHRDFSIYPSNKTAYIQSSSGDSDPAKIKDREKIFNHKSLVHLKSDYNCY